MNKQTKGSAKRRRPPSPEDAKPPVRQRTSGADRLAHAIHALSTTVAPTVHERAIEALNEHYANCLTDLQMVQAYSLMTNKAKAAVFVAMPPNRCRKLWLYSEIGADISNI